MARQHGGSARRVREGFALSLDREVQAYERHRSLKAAAAELGIPWTTLYARLKRAGVQVVGDPLRHGDERARLGALAEAEFHRLVPDATAENLSKHHAPVDFHVRGYAVDVKCARPRQVDRRYPARSWTFSIKPRQTLHCDFLCCFCMAGDAGFDHILLIPREFFSGLRTIAVMCSGAGKWLDYATPPGELSAFFDALPEVQS
jgi:hypothetical protein